MRACVRACVRTTTLWEVSYEYDYIIIYMLRPRLFYAYFIVRISQRVILIIMIIPITYCVSPHMRMRSSSHMMKAQNWVNYGACELLICEAVGVAKRSHVKSLR